MVFFEFLWVILNAKNLHHLPLLKAFHLTKLAKLKILKIFKHNSTKKPQKFCDFVFYPNEYRLFFFSSTEINFVI